MATITGLQGFFSIPAGTKPSECDRCHQTIYWIEHRCKPKKGETIGKLSRLPISIKDNVHALAPTDTTWGQGFNHFADCIYAESFRRNT